MTRRLGSESSPANAHDFVTSLCALLLIPTERFDMSSQPGIVWFRLDLRLSDHAALQQALERHSSIIPVFIWAPEEESPWAPGGASRWWLHHSATALAADLERRGSRLIVRRGPTERALAGLIAETGAAAVYWNRRYEPAVIARDAVLKERFRAVSCAGNLLVEPWKVRTLRVFAAYWRAIQALPAPAPPGDAPARVPGPERWPDSVRIEELGLLPKTDWAGGLRESWSPGEAGARRELERFVGAGIADYASGRDVPGERGTSRLSPHLHFGEVSARQVWRAAADEGFRRELAWREFAHHLLYHFPETPDEALRPEFRRFPWRMNERELRAWTQGRTGYPLVDAGMRELWHTGWMHNRVRMVAASFLVKHLLIPWQEGAAWFWDTLVDADLANNTLGWQWSAGCGADAAPYFRIFNPVLQGQKFDARGVYVRRWIPELRGVADEWVHEPWRAPGGVPAGYVRPIVEHRAARDRALQALATVRGPRLADS